MKILVFGNISSGKTTLLNRLKEIVPFEVIAIDDYRRKYGNGSKEAEVIARENFLDAIEPNKNQFVECIGVGKVADTLYELLSHSDETIICLTLITPKEICKSRLENRIWDIPFPEPTEKVFALLEKTEIAIQSGIINEKWSKRKNTIIISKQNLELKDIDEIISQLIILMENEH